VRGNNWQPLHVVFGERETIVRSAKRVQSKTRESLASRIFISLVNARDGRSKIIANDIFAPGKFVPRAITRANSDVYLSRAYN